VVLEGAARAAADPGVVDGLRVVHASGSGDDEIAAVVAAVARADPRRAIVVVTADRGLRERVEAYGATTVGPRWLEWRPDRNEARRGGGRR
jgi:rRNA-processing protein FCF1